MRKTNFPRAGKNAAGKTKPERPLKQGLRAHSRQPKTTLQSSALGQAMRPQARCGRMRRDRTAASRGKGWGRAQPGCGTGEAGRRPHRAISCRTVSGTRHGAGSRRAGLHGWGPTQREAPFHFKNGQAGFRPERSEAGTEAGGRRRIPARVGSTTHNTGEVGRRPNRAISCRTVSGTGRGAGSRPAGLSRVGPIRREAPFLPQHPTCRFPAGALSEGRRIAADAQ